MEALVAAALRAGVDDARVLEALRAVPRAEFVPAEYVGRAEVDAPVRIPHGQVTSQPSLVAQMVAALALAGPERVLEVGTGYGWQTALLARLAREVVTVERFPDLAEAAQAALARHGARNVDVIVGDGTEGVPERAPFDAIVVAAAFTSVPAPLEAQLAEGGRLVQPIGPGGDDDVILFVKRSGALERVRTISGARFVRLYGRYGFE